MSQGIVFFLNVVCLNVEDQLQFVNWFKGPYFFLLDICTRAFFCLENIGCILDSYWIFDEIVMLASNNIGLFILTTIIYDINCIFSIFLSVDILKFCI